MTTLGYRWLQRQGRDILVEPHRRSRRGEFENSDVAESVRVLLLYYLK